MSKVALLDVNLLVALFDPNHVHHDLAHDWFADQRSDGWATCPVTENGVVRVLSHPAYGAGSSRPADVVQHLRQFCASSQHVFWPETVSLRDKKMFNPLLIRGYRQVGDIYLLGLATRHGGRLATFDQSIPLAAVVGATRETLRVISAAEA